MEFGCDDARIGDDEIVFRRISRCFVVRDENLHTMRPSTQAFKQNELSVYLASMTTPAAVASEGTEPYMVSLPVSVLREEGLGIVIDTSSGGPGHCRITGKRTKGKLNQIVKKAKWIDGYAHKGESARLRKEPHAPPNRL